SVGEEGVPAEREKIEVTYCCDSKTLAVATSDPFGSLTRTQGLEYLARCFKKQEEQVVISSGGSGLGFYLMFDAVSKLVVNISPGRRTEVIGLIDIRGSFKEFTSRSKSFNLFVTPR